jgi:membrane protease YdiL (CAAX protease family)
MEPAPRSGSTGGFRAKADRLRPRSLSRTRAWLGIAGAVFITAWGLLPQPDADLSPTDPGPEPSYEEEAALHYLDRSLRIESALASPAAGDGLWTRCLRWTWRMGRSEENHAAITLRFLRDLDERVQITPRGLAACAVAARASGDESLAREFGERLSADESDMAQSFAGLVEAWLDKTPDDPELQEILGEWCTELLDHGRYHEWWEARLILDLAPANDLRREPRRMREIERGLEEEWLSRYARSQAIHLGIGLLSLICLLGWGLYRPRIHRRPGQSPLVRRWGLLTTMGWFGWLTIAGYGVAMLASFAEDWGGPDPDGQVVVWQLFQLAGALWIWRLASPGGAKLIGLLPLGEARPTRWLPPALAFFALTSLIFTAIDLSQNGAGLLDAILDTTEPAQLGTERWPLRAIFFSVLTAVILAPLMEEIVHRGILHQALRTRLSRAPAILASSAIFAVLHPYSWMGMLHILLFGMIFAWLYERTRSLWPGIFLHALGNGLITLDQWLVWGPR